MKLSVVILNYNVRYFLEQCIRSVQKASKNIASEIIVIDNDSKDESCEMVKTRFPEVRLIENRQNVGFSKANNQAVAVAKGEYLCILNPDTAVAEDTFENAIHYAENIKNMGALGVYLMDGTGSFLPESKRNLPTPKVSLMKLSGFSKLYYSKLQATSKGEVDVLVGAFMLIKKSIYDQVGGFDEDYFMYGEDIDLSYKITKAGYTNHYLGSTTVLHYKGESTQRDDVYLKRFYGAMAIFYRKHFNKSPFLENAVAAGVAFVKKTRRISTNKNPKSQYNPQNFYFFTENEGLVEALSRGSGLVFQKTTLEFLQDTSVENSLMVFDAEYVPYREIFDLMKNLSRGNNLFRIRPPDCNFIIGSDQSDEKGGVILF